jgi:hypothetical protein
MTVNGGAPQYAQVIVDKESKLETFVSGQETWFVSVGATTVASSIMSLNNLFPMMGQMVASQGSQQAIMLGTALSKKTILQSVGTSGAAQDKMNLICATILDADVLNGVSSGYFKYGNVVLDRRYDVKDSVPVSMFGATMMQALFGTVQGGAFGYTLNITQDASKAFVLKPVDQAVSPLGIYPYNIDGSEVTDPSWLLSDEPAITLNTPTIGIMMGYYTVG